MRWRPDPHRFPRDRDTLLADVKHRAESLRRHRQLARATATAAALAVLGPIAFNRWATSSAEQVATRTAPTVLVPASSSPPSSAPDTTAAPPSTPVSPAPETTTTTTAPAEIPQCTASDFEAATVSTDQPSYPQGAVVTVTVSGRNISGRSCTMWAWKCADSKMMIETSSGETGWDSWRTCVYALPAPIGPTTQPPPPPPGQVVAPGESVTVSWQWDQGWKWDQRNCPNPSAASCPHAPPGQYRAVDTLFGAPASSALFQIG